MVVLIIWLLWVSCCWRIFVIVVLWVWLSGNDVLMNVCLWICNVDSNGWVFLIVEFSILMCVGVLYRGLVLIEFVVVVFFFIVVFFLFVFVGLFWVRYIWFWLSWDCKCVGNVVFIWLSELKVLGIWILIS